MASQDLTEILFLHNHMQKLDDYMHSMPLSTDADVSKEYDATMRRLVSLMGHAAKRKLS